MGGQPTSLTMRLLSLALILACAFSLRNTEANQRVKPADWDDALDGEWEPPAEGDEPTPDLPPTPPYEPPPKEQYLSQEPDAWKNNQETTLLWGAINKGDMAGLEALVKDNPRVVHARSEDGRGPLFWAYEYGKDEMVKYLDELGVDATVTDKDGLMPEQLSQNREL